MNPVGRRRHVFEFEDQPWFPSWLRNPMTDFLGLMARFSRRGYGPFIDRLEQALRETATGRLIDLGSGDGAAAAVISDELSRRGMPVSLVLTDLHPNVGALERTRQQAPDRITARSEPVDAAAVPADLDGFRLMCNSFHHLPPEVASRVLADAVRRGQGIAVLEMVERTPLGVLGVLVGLLVALVTTPFIRPFSIRRLVLTYLVPLIPMALVWDGVVSCLRVYSPEELRALVATVPGSASFAWSIERLPVAGAPTKLTSLIGRPVVPVRSAGVRTA